jgi:hypothetical protein
LAQRTLEVLVDKEPKLSMRERALLSEKDKKFDESATAEDCIKDLRAVQEENELKFITRNFYRNEGSFSDATWNQFFGTFHEFKREAGLELSRGQHSMEKKIAKHASLDTYRKFYKEQILPYHNKVDLLSKKGRFKVGLVCSDLHDIELDPFVWATFVDTAKQMQPDFIALGGDIHDLPDFSKYFQDPRKFAIKKRFDFVKEKILAPLRLACPKSQIDFIVGNHDLRILKILAEQTPNLRVILADVLGLSLADIFGLDDFDVNLVAKFDLSAFSETDIKDELKENFRVYYQNFVVHHYKDLSMGLSGASGHVHRPELVTAWTLPMGGISWNTLGCMKGVRTEYVDGMNKWTNGFGIAYIDTLKNRVQQQPIVIPGDHVVINGKLYERKKGLVW